MLDAPPLRATVDVHAGRLWMQSSQGKTLQSHLASVEKERVTTPTLAAGFAGALGVEGVANALVFKAASMTGIHFRNGDKSSTSWMYQTGLRLVSQTPC